MNNTVILLLIGAGAFLWYKNKIKRKILLQRWGGCDPSERSTGHFKKGQTEICKNGKWVRTMKFAHQQKSPKFPNPNWGPEVLC